MAARPASGAALREPGVVSLAFTTTHEGDHETNAALLSTAERERADGIRHPMARAEFVASRTLVRQLVGLALGQDPRDVVLVHRCGHCGLDTHGKPYARQVGAPWFSSSHARGVVLVALSVDGEVGIDVEPDHEVRDVDRLARDVLTPAESRRLLATDRRQRSRMFLGAWCAKEAILKRSGTGLAVDPRLVSGSDDSVVAIDPSQWPPAAYAAVAVPPGTRRLRWVRPDPVQA